MSNDFEGPWGDCWEHRFDARCSPCDDPDLSPTMCGREVPKSRVHRELPTRHLCPECAVARLDEISGG